MHQFGLCQDAFELAKMLEFSKLYPLSSTATTTELARLLRCGIYSTDIVVLKGFGFTPGYETQIQETWPISEIPPGAAMFSDAETSKKPWTSSDR